MIQEYSQPSTSKENTSATPSSFKHSRKRHWNEEDMLTLFKLIKHEYENCLKTGVRLPSKPWPTVIKKIAEKKLFKVRNILLVQYYSNFFIIS